MEILFKENDKRLYFKPIAYEFEKIEKEDDYIDANWLLVNIRYKDNEISFDEIDPSIQTFEIERIIEDIAYIIEGKKEIIKEEFLEPYLKIEIERNMDIYIFTISFVYDTSSDKWSEVSVKEEFTKEELINLMNSFKEILKEFPFRKTNKD